MIFSINFLIRSAIISFICFFSFSGCSLVKDNLSGSPQVIEKNQPIAVLPLENLSGVAAPLKDIKESLIKKLKEHGIYVLEEEKLEKFMWLQRIRYTGGIEKETAEMFKRELGAEAVLVTTLELYDETNPSKIGLFSRLVSTGENPVILWMDSVGLAGDDSYGILGLGLIEGHHLLREKALEFLTLSLKGYIFDKSEDADFRAKNKKFKPKASYLMPFIDPEKKYIIAVVPFLNESSRKRAGDIIMLHFVMQLKKMKNFDVVDPGIVRDELLKMRIIISEGISLSDADVILNSVKADFILNGRVMDYQDYIGPFGKTKVDFSAQLLDRMKKKIVWVAKSYNEGDDKVFLFDWGRVNTANAMASEMVKAAVESMKNNN